MASRQDRREASAEAHSRRAAEELARARDERVAQAEVDARTAADEIARARSDRGADYDSSGGGILEGARNFMSAVGRTFGGATDAAADKTTQTARATGDKARETSDGVARKTGEAAEATRDKMGLYKDAAVEKAREAKDAVAQKASEAADTTKNKLGEYRDTAADKAQETRDVSKQKAGDYADATRGTAQEARETAATRDADRRSQQGPGLLGALGNATGAIKDKLALGGGQQHHEVRLGGEDERAVKERAAEKAAEVYFEEKDRLARERAAGRVDRCVEGCTDPACAHRHGKI